MCLPVTTRPLSAALLQKYLDSYDLSIRVVYVLGTLGFSLGTAVMAMFANVYVAMIMISTMGVAYPCAVRSLDVDFNKHLCSR